MSDPRLFSGVFPTGISWADRSKREGGDYKPLAFLSFSTLVLEVRPGCPDDLRSMIAAEAAKIQADRGKQFQVSTCGQTITLGS